MGTGLIGMLTKRAKLHETRSIIDPGIESLISYGASNNSLPDTYGDCQVKFDGTDRYIEGQPR